MINRADGSNDGKQTFGTTFRFFPAQELGAVLALLRYPKFLFGRSLS